MKNISVTDVTQKFCSEFLLLFQGTPLHNTLLPTIIHFDQRFHRSRDLGNVRFRMVCIICKDECGQVILFHTEVVKSSDTFDGRGTRKQLFQFETIVTTQCLMLTFMLQILLACPLQPQQRRVHYLRHVFWPSRHSKHTALQLHQFHLPALSCEMLQRSSSR